MIRRIKKPSPAMIVAMVALFVALGGVGYAAVSLPRDSVGTKQLKNFAVTPLKIQNNAIKTNKLRDNAVSTAKLANGAATNPKIADGAVNSSKIADGSVVPADVSAGFQIPGMLVAHARVQADGTLEPNQFRNIAQANIEHVAASGVYCFGGLSFTPTNAMVSLDNAQLANTELDKVVSVAVFRGNPLNDCGAGFQQARVRVFDISAAAQTDGRFYIWFL